MMRLLTAALLALGIAGAAAAAPKDAAKGEKPCPAGVGTAVCCKASVANHCTYVSCCEQGNAGFFNQAHCATCEKHQAKSHAAHKGAAHACTTAYVSCCEQGNAAFFKKEGCSMCAAKKEGKAACCAADAKVTAKKK